MPQKNIWKPFHCQRRLRYRADLVTNDDGAWQIEREDAMSTYSNGTAPWRSYADNITAVIISRYSYIDKC